MTEVWEHPTVQRGIQSQLERLREHLDAGGRIVGWKVGLGSPTAMEQARISAPLVGFLASQAVIASGDTVSLQGWTRPAVEPELAIHVGRDLGPGADPLKAAAAIAGVGPAIELADVDRPLEDVEGIVAGNVFQRRVIFGDADRHRAGGDVSGITVEVLKNGAEVGSTHDPTALTGDLVTLTAHVASWLAAAGLRLEEGQVIIAGSVIPIVPVQAGDGVEYRCAPLGRLAVAFS
jgi:2-keto-4-pentenoate hydratase